MKESIRAEMEKTIILLLERAQTLSGTQINSMNEDLSVVVQSANALIITLSTLNGTSIS